MATIIKEVKYSRIYEKNAKNLKEAILASPSTGCDKFTLRKIEIVSGGVTARKSFNSSVVYYILSGKVLLSHDNGELDLLLQSNAVTIQKNEFHSLHNTGKAIASVLMIISQ